MRERFASMACPLLSYRELPLQFSKLFLTGDLPDRRDVYGKLEGYDEAGAIIFTQPSPGDTGS